MRSCIFMATPWRWDRPLANRTSPMTKHMVATVDQLMADSTRLANVLGKEVQFESNFDSPRIPRP